MSGTKGGKREGERPRVVLGSRTALLSFPTAHLQARWSAGLLACSPASSLISVWDSGRARRQPDQPQDRADRHGADHNISHDGHRGEENTLGLGQ